MKDQSNSILEMAKGAILEQTDIETGKIIQNILDLNTDPVKVRKMTIEVVFKPSTDRSQVVITANAKSKLQPNNAIQTSLIIGVDTKTGQLNATELVPNVPGQMGMDGAVQESPKFIKIG